MITRERPILTTDYNGAPEGLPHCLEAGCILEDDHCQRSLHAEQNAILQAAFYGLSIAGDTIYVTHQPCNTCAKMIINAGLKRAIYAGEYPDELARNFLIEAGVELVRFPNP